MKKTYLKTILCVVLAAVMLAALLLGVLSFLPRTHSSTSQPANVTVDANGLSVYVSGQEVQEGENGGYYVPAGASVTVTVVNETRVFQSLTIEGTQSGTVIYENRNNSYDYGCVAEDIVAGSGGLKITAVSRAATTADRGKLFSSPFTVDDAEDLNALSVIFAGNGIAEDYERFGLSAGSEADAALRYGYFRMTANIIANSEAFTGIGSRPNEGKGMPFQGCFDFGGFYAYIDISKTQADAIDFVLVDSINVADYGFFSYIYGQGAASGGRPCLVRGADVRGNIAINTVTSDFNKSGTYRINAGGIAGSIGKNVVLDGVLSQVSVSAQVNAATLVLGGLFGFSSASVDEWSGAMYRGDYGSVSGVTNGKNASVYVGGLAGILQNAYANGFVDEALATSFVANAAAEESGSAYVGGLAGIVYVGPSVYNFEETSSPRSITLRNFTGTIFDSYVLSAVIDNGSSQNSVNPDDFSTDSAGAVAGGFIGGIYVEQQGTSSHTVTISHVNFTGGEVPLTVSAQTLDGGSYGAVFAGGLVGYIQTASAPSIRYELSEYAQSATPSNYTFDCSTKIEATQNGVGPAYAGGMFGYNAFDVTQSGETGGIHFHLSSNDRPFEVRAVQTALSRAADKSMYDVCAGLYSSRLQIGYSVQNLTLYVQEATVTAQREAGSTATGDIAAGGFAGKASGSEGARLQNVSMRFDKNVSVNALGYSYDSKYEHQSDKGLDTGNNVYAGGFIGYVQNYDTVNTVNTVQEYYFSNISVKFGSSDEYAVRGVQNAISGNADYKTEGYVGGVFGMLANCTASALHFEGAAGGSLIYFTSSNNPNTANVGGLIGATRAGANAASASYGSGDINRDYQDYSVSGGTVKNAHVVGRAYTSSISSGSPYDLYAGGAIGVFGSETNITATAKDIYVYDTVVESIGEQYMLTYAGGVFGGIWYSGSLSADNCAAVRSNVTASSVSYRAFAAGIAGLLQGSEAKITNCSVVDSTIFAQADNEAARVAGIAVQGDCDGDEISNNYSNAFLNAKGNSTVIAPIYILYESNRAPWGETRYGVPYNKRDSYNNNYYVISNITTASTVAMYDMSGNPVTGYMARILGWGGEFASTYLALTDDAANYTSYSMSVNGRVNVYPHLGDTSLISVSGGNLSGRQFSASASGTYYVSVGIKVADETYTLCSYPVIVGGGAAAEDFSLDVADADTNQILNNDNAQNTDGYLEYTTGDAEYQYVLVDFGSEHNGSWVQNLLIQRGENENDYFPSAAIFYDLSEVDLSSYDDLEGYVGALVNYEGNAVSASVFNGKVSLSMSGTAGSQTQLFMTPSPTLSERVVILVEFSSGGKTRGVIAEFRPNLITAITVQPSSDTPAMGTTNDGAYIYAPGDTVRFEATVEYANPRNSYMAEVEFSGSNISQNGTFSVPMDAASGTKYSFTCTLLNQYSGLVAESVLESVTVSIVVRQEIQISYALSGANVSSDRKAVSNTPYNFTASPQPGYGLAPSISIGPIGDSGVFNGTALEGVSEGQGGTATWGGQDINYTYNKDTGAYSFTLPVDMLTGTNYQIQISFEKVYNIVFLANYTGDEVPAPLIVTVVAGSELTMPSGFESWKQELVGSRYGYGLSGFYLTAEANSASGYGNSFDTLVKEDENDTKYLLVNGPLMFYARWEYNIIVEAPQGVTVTSGLSSALVQDNGLVPIDDRHGFAFEVNTAGEWAGETRFSAYIRTQEGDYKIITSDFESGMQGWSISAELLSKYTAEYDSGLLYIRIYSDSLRIWQGDSLTTQIDSVRSDGVYTVEYSANYPAEPTGDVTLTFGQPLPSGTSLRLYYAQNGSAVWAGAYVLEQSEAEVVLAGSGAGFVPLSGFNAFPERSGARSESFRLVVTLPNNALNFTFGDAVSLLSNISVGATLPDGSVTGYGDTAEGLAAGELVRPASSAAGQEFTYYKADVRTGSVAGSGGSYTLDYTLTEGCSGAVGAPEDVRHASLRYVWEVRRADGGAIGIDAVSFTGVGGAIAPLLQSTSAVYFAAENGTLTLSGTGYIVSLLAVENTQLPAAGTVLWQGNISA